MLHDLQKADISEFNVFAVPQTQALAQQKILSLKGVEAWLFDCLQSGYLGVHEWADRGLEIEKTDAYNDYSREAKKFKDFAPRDRSSWARIIRNVLGPMWVSDSRRRAGEDRQRCLKLAGITDCREAFQRHLGSTVDWEMDANPEPKEILI